MTYFIFSCSQQKCLMWFNFANIWHSTILSSGHNTFPTLWMTSPVWQRCMFHPWEEFPIKFIFWIRGEEKTNISAKDCSADEKRVERIWKDYGVWLLELLRVLLSYFTCIDVILSNSRFNTERVFWDFMETFHYHQVKSFCLALLRNSLNTFWCDIRKEIKWNCSENWVSIVSMWMNTTEFNVCQILMKGHRLTPD